MDNFLVCITLEDISGEKLTHVDAKKEYQVECEHVVLGKEIPPSLPSCIIVIPIEY